MAGLSSMWIVVHITVHRSAEEALEIAALSGKRNSLGPGVQTVYDHTIIGMRSVSLRAQAPMAERQLRSRLHAESAMSSQPDVSNALKHRRQAATCGRFAANAQTAAERDLLLRLQRSLLARACHEDWVDGLPPLPPARVTALAVPRRKIISHPMPCE